MDLDQITLLYRVRKTVLQMLKDRGYIISEKKLLQSKEDFAQSYNGSRDSLNMRLSKRYEEGTDPNPMDQLYVVFPDQEKVNMETLTKVTLMMCEHNVLNAIIIVKGTTQISRRVSIITQ